MATGLDLNRKAWNSILFRPRILVDVDVADTSTQMLGQKTEVPVCAVATPILRFTSVADQVVLHLTYRHGRLGSPSGRASASTGCRRRWGH